MKTQEAAKVLEQIEVGGGAYLNAGDVTISRRAENEYEWSVANNTDTLSRGDANKRLRGYKAAAIESIEFFDPGDSGKKAAKEQRELEGQVEKAQQANRIARRDAQRIVDGEITLQQAEEEYAARRDAQENASTKEERATKTAAEERRQQKEAEAEMEQEAAANLKKKLAGKQPAKKQPALRTVAADEQVDEGEVKSSGERLIFDLSPGERTETENGITVKATITEAGETYEAYNGDEKIKGAQRVRNAVRKVANFAPRTWKSLRADRVEFADAAIKVELTGGRSY